MQPRLLLCAVNELNVNLQYSILALAGNGWSNRRIARELGINRETVGKYLLLARPKPAISTPGSEPDPNSKPAIPIPGSEPSPDSKPAISTAGSAAGRQSLCQPHSPQIEAAVGVGLSAQRIYQDLVCDHGFVGSYQAVKRFVRHLRETQPIPFVRMEVEPGAEAQVDFGQGAWVVVDGKRKRPQFFRVVLSHSRKGYSEVVWRQTTECFIRCLENSFRYFGGVPKTTVIDNLRAAVTRADWYDPDINPKVEEFCRHYGTVIMPTRPAMPRHKGKVEAGVRCMAKQTPSRGASSRVWLNKTCSCRIGNARWRIRAFTAQPGSRSLKYSTRLNGPHYDRCRRACFRSLKKHRAVFTGTVTSKSNGPITRCPRSMSGGRSGCAGSAD